MEEKKNHMSFKDKKYTVVKSAISKEKSDFIFKYFLLKRKVARYLFDNSYMSPFREDWGMFNDPQVPKTYSHYSDIAMEVLLEEMLPVLKKETELDLVPTYSYARLYKKGDELKRHKDRESCEISTTLNLGGDSWPIFLEPNKNVGISGVKINLEPGDMLIYSGCVLEHWRETFEGEVCGQVFLHYNNIKTSGEEYKFDKRPFLGLPNYYNQ